MKIITGMISAAVVAVVAVLIVYSFEKRLSAPGGKRPPSPLIGMPAPEFSLKLFDGTSIDTQMLRGKTVVINFWASWCVPCAREAEELNRAAEIYGKQVAFIGINVMDTFEEAVDFMAKHKVKYPNGYDPGQTVHIDYGLAGVPETFFIDGGNIVRKISGAVTFTDISRTLASIKAGQN